MKGASTISIIISLVGWRHCAARSWVTLVDPTIYATAGYDPHRVANLVEADPFSFPDTTTTTTNKIKKDATATPTTTTVTTTIAPPSAAPTGRDENLVQNGNCPLNQWLYRVQMHDSWGDGWNGQDLRLLEMPQTAMATDETAVIHHDNETHTFEANVPIDNDKGDNDVSLPTVLFQDTLDGGFDGDSYVCLRPHTCYQVVVVANKNESSSGFWQDEIAWDIQSAPVSPFAQDRRKHTVIVARGRAPARCQFAVVPEYQDNAVSAQHTNTIMCPNPCPAILDATMEETSAHQQDQLQTKVDRPSQSSMPSDVPSLLPSSVPSSWVHAAWSVAPSDAPSVVPSSVMETTTAAAASMAPPKPTKPPVTLTTTSAAPTTSAPTSEAHTTSAATTSAPTTSAPTTSDPTTSAPTTSDPTTSAPTTSAPTTLAPTTSAPTTLAPTTSAPTTLAPTVRIAMEATLDEPSSAVPSDAPSLLPSNFFIGS